MAFDATTVWRDYISIQAALRSAPPEFAKATDMFRAAKQEFERAAMSLEMSHPHVKLSHRVAQKAVKALKLSAQDDAKYITDRLASGASLKVGDKVMAFKGGGTAVIESIDGDTVTLDNGQSGHISRLRRA